jgi:hypothetical protein
MTDDEHDAFYDGRFAAYAAHRLSAAAGRASPS